MGAAKRHFAHNWIQSSEEEEEEVALMLTWWGRWSNNIYILNMDKKKKPLAVDASSVSKSLLEIRKLNVYSCM